MDLPLPKEHLSLSSYHNIIFLTIRRQDTVGVRAGNKFEILLRVCCFLAMRACVK